MRRFARGSQRCDQKHRPEKDPVFHARKDKRSTPKKARPPGKRIVTNSPLTQQKAPARVQNLTFTYQYKTAPAT
jgi:hypothetical protein